MPKILYSIFLFLIFLTSTSSHAVDDGDWWLQRNITIGDGNNTYGKKVYGSAARSVIENVPIKDSTREEVRQLIKRSIAVDKPTPTKVGSSMLKRIYSPQAIVGTAAVTGLLAAIGWVMEDGKYVKKFSENYSGNALNIYTDQTRLQVKRTIKNPDPNKACDIYAKDNQYKSGFFNGGACIGKNDIYPSGVFLDYASVVIFTDNNEKIAILTAGLLGAAMLGSQYTDPDPNFDNDTVNTGDTTGVKEIYEHDPSGVGNELADAMDDKLKNAKPTDDAKPSWIGDPKYDDRPLSDDRDDSSDRSWDEKGDEATGTTEPTKDPLTGENTGGQSISLQFPLFCSWASKMCQWYDDWKASDKVYKDHMTKTEKHQTQEKGFWQSVKDWFDWTKDDTDLPDRDESDLNSTTDFEEKNISLNVSPLCPSPTFETVTLHGVTSQVKTSDYTYICQLDWLIKPFTIGFATIMACFILFGFNRGSEE